VVFHDDVFYAFYDVLCDYGHVRVYAFLNEKCDLNDEKYYCFFLDFCDFYDDFCGVFHVCCAYVVFRDDVFCAFCDVLCDYGHVRVYVFLNESVNRKCDLNGEN